jgi:Cu/Ag efflux protein CusF
MKMKLLAWVIGAGIGLNTVSAFTLYGGTSEACACKRTATVTVTAVDRNQKVVLAKGFWGMRRFNLAEDCAISLLSKPDATLVDLQPGHRVRIRYENAKGVLVAREIAEQEHHFTGYVTDFDAAHGTLRLKHGIFARKFTVPSDCVVVLNNEARGSLNDVKIGDKVKVIYELGADVLVARRIVQPESTFAGTIQSMDPSKRIVTADGKVFHLAHGCRFVIAGRADGKLPDLRKGDSVSITYQDVNGVLVADRVGAGEAPAVAANAGTTTRPTSTAGASRDDLAHWPIYPPM